MAGNIKGITIEIGGDTSGLQKSINALNKPIKETQQELKKVEMQLKMDPTNVELLRQKQELLNKTVTQTAEKLDTLKEAAAEAQKQLDAGAITNEQFDILSREIYRTEQELERATKAANEFSVGLQAAKGHAENLAKGAQNVANKTKALSAAAAGVVAGLGGAAINAAKTADDLNTLAKQSGLTTEEIQKFQYAADIVDVSADDIISAQTKLIRSMTSTSEATTSAFAAIGVSTTNLDGSLRSSNEVFYEVLEGLAAIPNETERDALAMDIFGKSASQLAGIIDDGGAALKDLGDQASELGVILDQETLDSLNAVNDQLDTLKANAQGQIAKAGAQAMEALMPLFEEVIGYLSSALEWIGNLDTDTIKLILTIAAVVAAISPIAGIIADISGAVSSFLTFWPSITGAFSAVTSFAAANPMAVVAAAVVALAALVIANWDKIKPVLDEVLSFIKGHINALIGFINGLIEGINTFIRRLNSIRIDPPAWVKELTGIGSLGFNIPTIGKIPMLANGGLLSGGSAIVGEAGAELLSMTDRGALVQPLTNYNTTNNYNTAVPAVDINFTGNLAQLARVLQPHIALETTRRG